MLSLMIILLFGLMESDCSGDERVCFFSSVLPAGGQKCKQSVLGVGVVFEDGGGSAVHPAVGDALQGGGAHWPMKSF